MSSEIAFPSGWHSCTLGELADFEMGQAPPGDECNFTEEGTVFVKAGEFGKPFPFEKEWTTRPLKHGRKGDVFICVVGATCGKLNLGIDCAIGRSVAAIRPTECLDQRFLYFQLQPLVLDIRAKSAGSAQGVINKNQLAQIPIRLAALNEQLRIVAKIEELFSELDAGVAALERVRAGLKRYRAAVLKAAVEGKLTEDWRAQHPDTEPASVLLERILAERRRKWEAEQLAEFERASRKPPKEWQGKYRTPDGVTDTKLPSLPQRWVWATVDQLADVGTGTTPLRSNEDYYKDGSIPWVTSTAVNLPVVHSASEFVTDRALAETTLRLYPPQTLIIALYGEGKTRGKVSELAIEATINQALAALVMTGTASSCRAYLKLHLAANYEKLRRQAAGGMQPNLNLGLVRSIDVALPPRDEQVQIVAEVDRRLSVVDELATQVEADLKRASRLRQGILKRAFEGKLVPQAPTDEPAEQLLARIRQGRQSSSASENGKPATRRRGRPRKASAALPLFTEDHDADEGGES